MKTPLPSPAARTNAALPDPPGPCTIIRSGLLARLDQSNQFPITLILAPAGSGKSTLLRQWQTMRPSRKSVRLSLQVQDRDPVHFLRRLINGIRQLSDDFDISSCLPFDLESTQATEPLLQLSHRIFDGVRGELFILLDDFQVLDQSPVPQLIAGLVEQLPTPIHFILSSRNHPGFSLSKLQLEHRLLLIDRRHLQLDRQQVLELNQLLGGALLPEILLDRLLALTEGWMTGVKIALIAYARSGMDALTSFNGSQPELVDYFGYVVLHNLSSQVRSFLLQTAVLDRFNGELCDQVLLRQDSARILDQMSFQQLFLLPVEEKPGWYRHHALLNDFLRNRLQIEQPELISPILSRAVDYHLDQGEPELALSYAKQYSDHDFFIKILELCCDNWLREGNFREIIRWVEPLPEKLVLDRADLAIPLICSLILSRRFNQARYYLDSLKGNPLWSDQGRLGGRSTQTFLELTLQLFQQDTDFRADADLEALLNSSGHRDIRAFSLAMIAYHKLLHGYFDESINYAIQAKTVLAQLGYRFLETYADLILALCDRAMGHSLNATQTVEQAFRKLEPYPHTPSWINIATARVVMLYEQNQLTHAQLLCEELIPLVGSACATEVITTVYLTLSRILYLQGKEGRARRLLEQLSRILQLGNYDRFVGQLAQERMLQALHHEQPEVLDELAEHYRLPQRFKAGYWRDTREYDESWERYGLATAYWLQRRGCWEDAETVLGIIAASLKRYGAKARALVMEANLLVVQARAKENTAGITNRLRRLVKYYGLTNINRSTFDEAPGFARLLEQTLQDIGQPLPESYRNNYPDIFMTAGPKGTAPSQTISLTGKEQEIMELLVRGLDNSSISKQTGIALSTTKWHLKNIYAKLGVSNRTEAIRLQSSQASARNRPG